MQHNRHSPGGAKSQISMRHGSLFSGMGGFDLAADWMGWENVFHCEIAPFPRRILTYYWPNAISYEDITQTDFSPHRGEIDILTGGFPCQPYSVAGERLGKEDDRHLWPQMLRAIREIGPRWVVGENVRGLVNWSQGLVFDEVHADLEAEGYEVQAFVLPACATNAPHRRDRVWFVGYANPDGLRSEYQLQARGQVSKKHIDRTGTTTDPDSQRLQGGEIFGVPKESETRSEKQPSRFIQSTWKEFPTQPPVCGRDDGFPEKLDGIAFSKWRGESIKGFGNAVVPQVVFQIYQAIADFESLPYTAIF